MPTRRKALKTILSGAALATAPGSLNALPVDWKSGRQPLARKGNIRHSVCRWCFNDFPLDTLCVFARQIGLSGIDLVGPADWPVLKAHGLDSSMCNGAEINLVDGWNDPKFHEQLIRNYSEMIPLVAKAGYRNLICFSGNRRGMDDETGLKNCVEGLKKVMGLAEKHSVILQIEVFNSKVNHPDYMADNTPWTIELCKRIGSEHFKILYDIYHMQINEGDVIRTIRDHHDYFGHYHTAGVPGRHEIDESQELYYPAIMRAIVDTGFKGYVAQEFIPVAGDKLASLAAGVDICDV
ncbi:MAG: TIM barrel protein [Saprospiraceae bacterium]|nr:TIM barrel protein [Lewinellaceae bacterium]